MKKLSVAAIILGLMSVATINSAVAAPVVPTAPIASPQDAAKVEQIIAQIEDAVRCKPANSGAANASCENEEAYANALRDAITSNPTLAQQIVEALTEKLNSHNAKASFYDAKFDVSVIVNAVLANLQNGVGNEFIVAALLGSVATAAGGSLSGLPNEQYDFTTLSEQDLSFLPKENENQTSPQ